MNPEPQTNTESQTNIDPQLNTDPEPQATTDQQTNPEPQATPNDRINEKTPEAETDKRTCQPHSMTRNAGTAAYTLIDRRTWPRTTHFDYFRKALRCGYALTKPVDVTAAVEYAHRTGRSFYACTIWAISRTVNSMDEMRMMVDTDGNPGIWEISNPSFTILHEDDHTFSDLWMEYVPEFEAFYEAYENALRMYGNHKGVKAREGQPPNFFCISSVPWLDYTAYDTYTVDGDPHLFPIVTTGMYQKYKVEVSTEFPENTVIKESLAELSENTAAKELLAELPGNTAAKEPLAESADSTTAKCLGDVEAAETVANCPGKAKANDALTQCPRSVFYKMPVTINISHAAADGYHIGQFYGKLSDFLGRFERM